MVMVMAGNDLREDLDVFLAGHEAELIEFRRDLHAHPELAYAEHRTTRRVALRLAAEGLRPVILPKGTGLYVDIVPPNYPEQNPSAERAVVALRADIDALPMTDEKDVPYRSTNPGACHACGHDVHATVLLGVGLFLAGQPAAGLLPGRVRLVFQPAEESAGGAIDVLAAGGLASVGRIFALHCDPRLDAGQLGVRSGAITAACDKIEVRVSGPGGHTARPHLTADLVYGLGKIITEVPAGLSRRGLGPGQRGDPGQRHPRQRGRGRDRALPGRRGLALGARPAQGAHRLGGLGLRAERRVQLPALRAAHGQRPGQYGHDLRRGARRARRGLGRADGAEPRRRGLRLVPRVRPRRPGPPRKQGGPRHQR